MAHRKKIQTDWEELGISNDFIFGKVMQDPELCDIYLPVGFIWTGTACVYV